MTSPVATVIALIATICLAVSAYWWLADPARARAGTAVLAVLAVLALVALAVAFLRRRRVSLASKGR